MNARYCLLLSLFVLAIPLSDTRSRAEDKKADDKLEAGQYRVKVECVVERPGDLAIYRVQVWTVEKQRVKFSIVETNGGRISQSGNSLPDSDGKLHCYETVITVAFRPHPDPKLRGQCVELEKRLLRAGPGVGGLNLIEAVAKDTKWESVVDLATQTTTKKIGQAWGIGKLHGQVVEVSVDKPK